MCNCIDPYKIPLMPLYSYSILLITLLLAIIIVRCFPLRKKNIASRLFAEALRKENIGNFEAAAIAYENALNEVRKIRFHNSLKNKTIEKLKLMHTIIQYEKDIHFVR